LKISELKAQLKSIDVEEKELKAALGSDRYEKVTKEINDLISRNDLNEFQAYHLLNLLSQIYRLERTHL
jgi:hypothetical protein